MGKGAQMPQISNVQLIAKHPQNQDNSQQFELNQRREPRSACDNNLMDPAHRMRTIYLLGLDASKQVWTVEEG
jgi:hypothetical protein